MKLDVDMMSQMERCSDTDMAAMMIILVVDDDPGCRKLTSRVLKVNGYGTVVACNGLEALEILKQQAVDMILLDLMMPEMDGLEFMAAMRAEGKWNQVPVLVLSGVADLEMAKKVRDTGVQGYLVKSQYSIDELLWQVSHCLMAPRSHPN